MSETPTLREQIQRAIDQNEVILFMKGTPDRPMCGFSQRSAATLTSLQVPFASVDILPDPRIREELSAISQWPTIPQLFVRGELVGGCDIILEMADTGELQSLLGVDGTADAGSDEPAPLQIENRLN